MTGNDAAGMAATAVDRSRRSWPADALLALGAWLVVSPLLLALGFGVRLLLAPSLREFTDGRTPGRWSRSRPRT